MTALENAEQLIRVEPANGYTYDDWFFHYCDAWDFHVWDRFEFVR